MIWDGSSQSEKCILYFRPCKMGFYSGNATRILTMWHKLALSVIPPVRTRHVILKHVSNLSWVIVSTLRTAEVKLNKIS